MNSVFLVYFGFRLSILFHPPAISSGTALPCNNLKVCRATISTAIPGWKSLVLVVTLELLLILLPGLSVISRPERLLLTVKVSQQVSICHNLPTILKAKQLFYL